MQGGVSDFFIKSRALYILRASFGQRVKMSSSRRVSFEKWDPVSRKLSRKKRVPFLLDAFPISALRVDIIWLLSSMHRRKEGLGRVPTRKRGLIETFSLRHLSMHTGFRKPSSARGTRDTSGTVERLVEDKIKSNMAKISEGEGKRFNLQ